MTIGIDVMIVKELDFQAFVYALHTITGMSIEHIILLDDSAIFPERSGASWLVCRIVKHRNYLHVVVDGDSRVEFPSKTEFVQRLAQTMTADIVYSDKDRNPYSWYLAKSDGSVFKVLLDATAFDDMDRLVICEEQAIRF